MDELKCNHSISREGVEETMRFIVMHKDNKENMESPYEGASVVEIKNIEELISFVKKHGRITIDDRLIGVIYTHNC